MKRILYKGKLPYGIETKDGSISLVLEDKKICSKVMSGMWEWTHYDMFETDESDGTIGIGGTFYGRKK